mmetsp:Transcript_81947/g.228395  ORF Transcript_81947/g.228395 Transcript_81947/m.228395 type:complete len:247 (+) Transcript_81947:1100-1840(+)
MPLERWAPYNTPAAATAGPSGGREVFRRSGLGRRNSPKRRALWHCAPRKRPSLASVHRTERRQPSFRFREGFRRILSERDQLCPLVCGRSGGDEQPADGPCACGLLQHGCSASHAAARDAATTTCRVRWGGLPPGRASGAIGTLGPRRRCATLAASSAWNPLWRRRATTQPPVDHICTFSAFVNTLAAWTSKRHGQCHVASGCTSVPWRTGWRQRRRCDSLVRTLHEDGRGHHRRFGPATLAIHAS